MLIYLDSPKESIRPRTVDAVGMRAIFSSSGVIQYRVKDTSGRWYHVRKVDNQNLPTVKRPKFEHGKIPHGWGYEGRILISDEVAL